MFRAMKCDAKSPPIRRDTSASRLALHHIALPRQTRLYLPICLLREVISALKTTFEVNGKPCARTQIPLRLAWAVTIHKSQGLTLKKIKLGLGKKEFSTGLTFVGLSRVASFKDIMIVDTLDYSRIAKLGVPSRRQRTSLPVAQSTKCMSPDMKITRLSDIILSGSLTPSLREGPTRRTNYMLDDTTLSLAKY
ncbi:hypothetical protein DFP72DRAFT_847008 [Ephemerocybe angulata]|uniref:ATP-dependent DNA helicase n=1 Tax=Ephemerocybe angulata TaxID=980116 RepID=A0A8H6I094_9AGAR|nr:hypothetical protein DFP72DRAFT_847008 [Tulosesus angulatus]